MEKRCVGRFAPTPSGRMHLGNVFAALLSWLSPKSRGGGWILRMEDLDTLRTKEEYAQLLRDDLRWLVLDFTVPSVTCRNSAVSGMLISQRNRHVTAFCCPSGSRFSASRTTPDSSAAIT